MLQAAYRARLARLHVAQFRAVAQLRAKWASVRLSKAVKRSRAHLQARADMRPLLLRPDSSFVHWWKVGVCAVVLVEVLGLSLAGDSLWDSGEVLAHNETLDHLVTRLLTPSSCMPSQGHDKGLRDWRTLGMTRTAPGGLPAHCDASESVSTLIAAVLVSILATLIEAIAVADTFVEYFIGVLHPTTGVLVPKPLIVRYLQPPHSLAFNCLLNPALPTANRVLSKLLLHPNSNHFWRILFMFQPFRIVAEEWLTPRLRGLVRTLRARADRRLRAIGVLPPASLSPTRTSREASATGEHHTEEDLPTVHSVPAALHASVMLARVPSDLSDGARGAFRPRTQPRTAPAATRRRPRTSPPRRRRS